MANIVVTGYMARHPLAGNMLAYFHYVLGFARLGHRVVYVEESGWPASAFDPTTGEYEDWPHEGLRRTRALTERFCPEVAVVFVDRETRRIDGASWHDLRSWLRGSDLLLDLGGVCWLDEFALAPRLALVDMDPLFTQVGGFAFNRLDAYDVHFTYGGNVGRPGCTVPTTGHEWTAIPPPVVTDLWDGLPAPAEKIFTTIANWTAYGAVEHGGRRYGQKDEEFLKLAGLPQRVSATLEIAAAGAAGAVQMRRGGWRFASAAEITDDFDRYRSYIASSWGEVTAAKNAYVASWSGWFSDRSACYLAAGRPVILQETGFSDWLPAGEGLLSFTNEEEAAAAIIDVLMDLPRHAAAARAVAAGKLAHDVVLPGVIEKALSTHGAAL